jgi:hypothetical protein
MFISGDQPLIGVPLKDLLINHRPSTERSDMKTDGIHASGYL